MVWWGLRGLPRAPCPPSSSSLAPHGAGRASRAQLNGGRALRGRQSRPWADLPPVTSRPGCPYKVQTTSGIRRLAPRGRTGVRGRGQSSGLPAPGRTPRTTRRPPRGPEGPAAGAVVLAARFLRAGGWRPRSRSLLCRQTAQAAGPRRRQSGRRAPGPQVGSLPQGVLSSHGGCPPPALRRGPRLPAPPLLRTCWHRQQIA